MKAPNKIYLRTGMSGLFYGSKEKSFETDVEYIRKDILLGKLKKAAASYKKRSDEGELVWQNMCGINEAINILNEM